jgi:arylsulfatase A-like enzyme
MPACEGLESALETLEHGEGGLSMSLKRRASAVALGSVVVVVVVTGLMPVPAQSSSGESPPERPNVLFIVVDDLNDWTGFMDGHPGIKTPQMDKLAAMGTVFTRAYCAAPSCNPSRTSVLTGVRPSTSGVYYNANPWREQLPEAVTLPRHFKDNGYQVWGAGKIFHGGFTDRPSFHDYTEQPRDPVPEKRPLNGIHPANGFDWGPLSVQEDAMGDVKIADLAVAFLQEQHEKPFFAAVGIFRPHLPWYVPREYFNRHPLRDIELPDVISGDLDDVPAVGRKLAHRNVDHERVLRAGEWERAVQGYMASISFADEQVGKVLDALWASPHGDDTIVVLWGDHGWHLGEKEHWRKSALWERATRVPLVIYAPDARGGSSRCERTVSLLDLYPTLADLCGLSRPLAAGTAGGPEHQVAAHGSRSRVGPARADDLRPREPYRPLGALALHPLPRRHGGALRSPERPQRMGKPGRRARPRRGEGGAIQVASRDQRRRGTAEGTLVAEEDRRDRLLGLSRPPVGTRRARKLKYRN